MHPAARLLAALVAVASCAVLAPAPAGAVVGGDEADAGEWPWQVVLTDGDQAFCGGALVALDVVVTAAHCTDDVGADDLEIVAGVVDLDDDDAQRRGAARVDRHEAYDPDTTENDIALVHLEQPFDASDAVEPVALPDAATSAALTAAGAPTVVTGFGATSEDGAMSDVLREAEVEAVDDATCAARYAEDGDEVFAPTNVCAGEDRGHIDACFGDSGGPLVAPADDERSGWYLVGIVSWGAGCGRPLRPTVYTEVAAFADWLDDHGAVAADGERFEGGRLRLPAAGTDGKADDYPATVEVDGFDGELDAVAVELQGLSHERPEDLDVWLVAPDGTTVTLLSDVGGDEPIVGADVVVESGGPAAGRRPLALRMSPTDRDPDRQRKGARPPADLDALAGIDPVGEWRLLVADDRDGAAGTLDAWTLVLA